MPGRGLVYVGGCLRDYEKLPAEVQEQVGFALLEAQVGGKHPDAKPLHGFGGTSVLEVVETHSSGTYRVVYTTKFSEAVYVLHAFQKKSTRDNRTSPRDMALIQQRFKAAEDEHARQAQQIKATENEHARRRR